MGRGGEVLALSLAVNYVFAFLAFFMKAGMATAPEAPGAFARICGCFSVEWLGQLSTKAANTRTAADNNVARIMRVSSMRGAGYSHLSREER
jgi:hypothetical protein